MEVVSRILEFAVTMPFAVLGLLAAVRFETRLTEVERNFMRSEGIGHLLRVTAAILTMRGVTTPDSELVGYRRRFFGFAAACLLAGIGFNALMAQTCWLPGSFVYGPDTSLTLHTVECRPAANGAIERIQLSLHFGPKK